jgi:hypothetical protein
MNIPENIELFEGELATYWFLDNGILASKSKSPVRTLKNTSETFDMIKRITNNNKVCLLVYLCPSPVPDKATRDYVAKELPNVYRAMAMVTTSALGKLVMNMVFSFKPPTIPMRTFSKDVDAIEWLKKYQ